MRANSAPVAKATAKLAEETSVPSLLTATARMLVELVGVEACTISRVIGDLLVDLVQHRRIGEAARLGHGYLISDYPLTREVLAQLEPRTVFVADADADPDEVRLLREMGFDALLMAAIEVDGAAWGLIEVYGEGSGTFADEDVKLVREVARAASVRLKHLEGHGSARVEQCP